MTTKVVPSGKWQLRKVYGRWHLFNPLGYRAQTFPNFAIALPFSLSYAAHQNYWTALRDSGWDEECP